MLSAQRCIAAMPQCVSCKLVYLAFWGHYDCGPHTWFILIHIRPFTPSLGARLMPLPS
jgi:hypothetical protein